MCDKKLYYPVTFRFSLIIHFSFLMSITSRFAGFRSAIRTPSSTLPPFKIFRPPNKKCGIGGIHPHDFVYFCST
nr:MAG TPA: hypothetical protein [Caudoviricetes sp.]